MNISNPFWKLNLLDQFNRIYQSPLVNFSLAHEFFSQYNKNCYRTATEI